MDVIYGIGNPEEDGTLAAYGFSIPNIHANDENEETDVDFRWAEKIAAVKAPASPVSCEGMTLKVSSPQPQKVKVDLIANGYAIREENYADGGTVKHIEWEIPRGTSELADTSRYYYVKVTQEKGPRVYPLRGYAWPSPVWVDYEYADNPIGKYEEEDRVFMDMEECQMAPFASRPPRPTRAKRRSIMDL